ncbi:MAG TPA: hypothetical protein ENI16_00285 [Candidatus Portnoybacteria bacterium]|nr:hypothetical protein [Candidatus Portnoybacteria bacterium]
MNREKKFIPSIEKEEIGPEKKLPEAEKERRIERREREDSLSRYILEWWKGDAHTHSKESTREEWGYPEGLYDIEEAMDYYKELGLEFVCFTEHASKPGSPEKQSPESRICQSLLKETERITEVNLERKGDIAALSGVETNIFFDENDQPTLDLPEEVLQKLDIVIASRHAIVREKEPEAIKETLLFAIRNPDVDVIGHPDRYTRQDREKSPEYWQKYWNIWPEILQEIKDNNKAFEVNLNSPPSRKLTKMAVETGVKFFINYDAHDFNQYKKEKTELTRTGEEAKKKWAKEEVSKKDLEILKEYKTERLSSGPGFKSIFRLAKWIKRLESLGVRPERVINSSRENLIQFLTKEREKNTLNLSNLRNMEERPSV